MYTNRTSDAILVEESYLYRLPTLLEQETVTKAQMLPGSQR